MNRRIAALLLTLWILPGFRPSQDVVLERPPALQPAVAFWTRIYAEVDSNAGLVHDARHLDVVYEMVRLPEDASYRTRERLTSTVKKKYALALRTLSKGKRTNLSSLEARVLALWPEGVSNRALRQASERVRFQRGLSDRFAEGVVRAGRWEPYIRDVFAEEGIPPEIAALPHVESSFNPHAYSHAGAAGLWQFTRGTGRLFLRIDYVVDERLDPWASTQAAAALLQDNYRKTGTWPLAVTAYNHGSAGMARAVRELGSDDISVIVDKYDGRTFGFASRNFYAELLAAIEVERNAERYFGALPVEPPADYTIVELDHYYRVSTLQSVFGVDAKELREHNLSLLPPVWRDQKYVPRGYVLRIPSQRVLEPAPVLLAAVPSSRRYTAQKRDTIYRVQRGDTLSGIARRFEVSQNELVALNGLRSRHRIRIGQKLRLPPVDSPSLAALAQGSHSEPRSFRASADGTYRVRRGDNLSAIAAGLGVDRNELARANGIRNANRIQPGQTLKLPGKATEVARAEPTPPPAAEAAPVPVAAVEAAPVPVATAEAAPVTAAETADAPLAEAVAEAAPELVAAPARASSALHATLPAGAAPLVDDGRYAVAGDGTISVEPEETLGHYAEWLGVPTSSLRRLNGMRYGTALPLGRRVKLDFSRTSRSTFEGRRWSHHEAIRATFFEAYRVAGTHIHVLRPGESLWSLARSNGQVPLWLLQQYNPKIDFARLRAGDRIHIPNVEARG